MLLSVGLSHCRLFLVRYPFSLFILSFSLSPDSLGISAKGIAVLEGSCKLSSVI